VPESLIFKASAILSMPTLNRQSAKGGRLIGDTLGNPVISAWQVAPGACWLQTSSARHARRLSQRSDTRIVGKGVAGGFLRIFEVNQPLAWAKRFIARHETNEEPTNGAVLVQESPTSRRKMKLARTGGLEAGKQQKGDVGEKTNIGDHPNANSQMRSPLVA
jgi:hypothetical protein